MDRQRLPAAAGAVVSLLAAVLVVVPYLLPDAGPDSIATYYDFGFLGGLTVLIVALVAVVVFAAGQRGRSEPAVAAGAGLGLAVVAVVLAASWAMAVPYDVVVGITTEEWFEYHRYSVLASTIAMTVCGTWYAYALRLF